ncbi:MAG: BACON domain-containing protein, partial [Candidatus Aminicenantes bacterium]|nr:BACON domain-containing protein [Candidatus Aminicenantes bacterium]
WEEIQFVGPWYGMSKMPDIDIGAGHVSAVFMSKPGADEYYHIAYSERGRAFNSSWSDWTYVHSEGEDQMHPAIRVDAADNAHIIYMAPETPTRGIYYVRKSGAGCSSPVLISTWDMHHYPFLAKGGGSIYAVWQKGGWGGGTAMDYNILSADGTWSGVASVPGSAGCTYGDIAATPDGSIVYWVWDTNYSQSTAEIFGWAQAFAPPNPSITLGKNQLFFGAVAGGSVSSAQTFTVVNSGLDSQNWAVMDNQSWLSATPANGSGSGRISVTVDPSGLGPGSYTGIVSVSDPNAPQYLPKTVAVSLTVYSAGTTSGPIGAFETPNMGTTVRSSVPVTGWALDEIGVQAVKIYRDPIGAEPGGSLVYIGDAVFVEGARPDVAGAYPTLPSNRRAGWGYMLLTNFLPGGGNGNVTLWAVAQDLEGQSITLGSKTFYCDNANAVNPFGAIDTPGQGGTASGSAYVNFGWALTPMPASIPFDGSTITVWVDGLPLGHPAYNNYREDIATLFPGYANTDGAVGFLTIDTTGYTDGVHTIAWSVSDDSGHADGIGSRYFDIFNGTGASSQAEGSAFSAALEERTFAENVQLPVFSRIGWNGRDPLRMLLPESDGRLVVRARETERMEIHLDPEAGPFDTVRPAGLLKTRSRGSAAYRGYLDEGGEARPLPAGSFLDPETGTFAWTPGPGFLGDYRLVFLDNARGLKRVVTVRIVPKF